MAAIIRLLDVELTKLSLRSAPFRHQCLVTLRKLTDNQ
jgi:hypothetical protein